MIYGGRAKRVQGRSRARAGGADRKAAVLAVFFPALDLKIGKGLPRKRFHEPAGELHVGKQGDGKIHSRPADDIVVGQLFLLVVLRDVDQADQV